MTESTRHAIDAAAIVGAAGAFVGALPAIAALFSIVWLGLQIYSWIKDKKWRRTPNG